MNDRDYRIDAPGIGVPAWHRVLTETNPQASVIWQHEEDERPCAVVEVGPAALRTLRRPIVDAARLFRREFDYNFVLYSEVEDGDARDRAITWVKHRWVDTRSGSRRAGTLIGAASFRWRCFADAPEGYALQWVWFHPSWRRAGLLRACWPTLRFRFGDFAVERPLSSAMQGFLAAVEPDAAVASWKFTIPPPGSDAPSSATLRRHT